MSASIRHFSSALATLSAVSLSCMVCAAFAQMPVTPARVDVPDGAPELVAEKNVTSTSVTALGKASASVIIGEERVQGRLSNARISVGGGKGYTVVDPNAGRTDRQADNGGKRVNPSLWELFRF